MKRLHWKVLAGLVVGGVFLAQGAGAESETPSLSAQIDELFADRSHSDAPGLVAAVIQDGRIVYENAFGMADLERGVALTPRSVFEIGSISKQFTAMCILLLEQDAKLSLDDEVRTYVRELPDYGRPITIRHLLHHTSGIRDIETLFPLAGWPFTNYYPPVRQRELITRQKELNFAPGSQFLYSNSGYLLLADIVERVSGQTLREFAEERIFQPLGMRHTVFWDTPGQIIKDRAIPYSPDPDGGYQMALWYLPFAGPSGLYTTVQDLALWDANFYDNKLGGGKGLIEKMLTPGLLEDGESADYAAGLFVSDYGDETAFEHGGAWMGYRAQMSRFPERRLTIITLSNASSTGVPMSSIVALFPRAEQAASESESSPFEPPSTIELPPEVLAGYEGDYWSDADLLFRTIEVRDGLLQYIRSEESTTELGAIEAGHFVMIGVGARVDVVFETGDRSRAGSMTVTIEGQEPTQFERLELLPAESLAGHEGSYWSDELERELRLQVEDETLHLAWADDALRVPMVQIGPDDFLARQFVAVPWNPQDVRILVERDEAHQVTGLSLSCDMVRGVSFVKIDR
ncbi:MAG: serine hydrolase domain-containing protein [Thermoanaerobaculia bacterium]